MQPPDFIKIKPIAVKPLKYFFKLLNSTLIQKIKIPQAQSNYRIVFTFSLPLSEGRAGEAWEPSNKMMIPPQ
jgi:hypothetical protein